MLRPNYNESSYSFTSQNNSSTQTYGNAFSENNTSEPTLSPYLSNSTHSSSASSLSSVSCNQINRCTYTCTEANPIYNYGASSDYSMPFDPMFTSANITSVTPPQTMPPILQTNANETMSNVLDMSVNRCDNDSIYPLPVPPITSNKTETNSQKILSMLEKGVENMQNALIISKVISAAVIDTNKEQNINQYVTKIQSLSSEIQQECDFSLKYLKKQTAKNSTKYKKKQTNKYVNMSDNTFKCNKCGKTYKHLCNLRSHLNVHSDSAYVCEFCGKKFGRKANCVEHTRVHTGDAPFKCQICSKQFKQKHGWKTHMKFHNDKSDGVQ